jgi:hypothetical protein
VKFDGSPTDPENKIALPNGMHALFTTWWNALRDALRQVSITGGAFNMCDFLEDLDRCPAATDSLIYDSERDLGFQLPEEYVEFLNVTNGGEGFIGKSSYVILWKVEELFSMNRSYETEAYAPGLIIFASDAGGEAYGFDSRRSSLPIVQVPFIGMDWNDAKLVGESFWKFLKYLYEAE